MKIIICSTSRSKRGSFSPVWRVSAWRKYVMAVYTRPLYPRTPFREIYRVCSCRRPWKQRELLFKLSATSLPGRKGAVPHGLCGCMGEDPTIYMEKKKNIETSAKVGKENMFCTREAAAPGNSSNPFMCPLPHPARYL